jgi:hypothetical protein
VRVITAGLGVRVTVTSVARDRGKQAGLYENYVRCGCNNCSYRPGSPHCFPAAHPDTSPHVLGIAFDLKLDPPGPLVVVEGRKIGRNYAIAGLLWESLGLRWGGRFRDEIHFDFWPKGYTPHA